MELENLLKAAKHALEFLESIIEYENSWVIKDLRQSIDAVEQSGAVSVGAHLLADLKARSGSISTDDPTIL